MAKFDVVDETVIEADPAIVYQALVDQAMGKVDWWLPHLEVRPRGNIPANQVDGLIEITVRRPGTPRFTARTIEARENELLRVEYVEGDFSGEGLWTLEPINGKTRLRFRWQVQPRRLLFRLLAGVVNFDKNHSEVMQAGFAGLNHYVKRKKEARGE